MCQQCQDLAIKYLSRWMPEEDMYEFMFSATCFPHGGPELIEPQLHLLNCIADQCGDIWLASAILRGMWETDYYLTRDTHKGDVTAWWHPRSLFWCEGLEQLGGEE